MQHHDIRSEQPDQTPLASICQCLMGFCHILAILPFDDACVQPTPHLKNTSAAMSLVLDMN